MLIAEGVPVRDFRRVAIVVDVHKPYDRQIVAGIAAYVRATGRWQLYYEDDPQSRLPRRKRWAGDGVIANFDHQRDVRTLLGWRLPTIAIGGGSGGYDKEHSHVPYVRCDQRQIAELAADHLLERGYRNFAFLGLRRTNSNAWADERMLAFQDCLEKRDLVVSVHKGTFGVVASWKLMLDDIALWLSALPKPLGVMACNDARARHALEACHIAGLRVPEDVALIGVDNDEIGCELSTPTLSSVMQGTFEIGYQAAALLDDWMRGGPRPPPMTWVAPPGIAARQSTDIICTTDEIVRAAARFIREQVGRGVTVAEVAAHMAVSRTTLHTKFKQELGHSVHQAIDQARLTKAKELLIHTQLPLKLVARQAGFGTQSYMSNVFRRSVGRSPGEIRQSALRAAERR